MKLPRILSRGAETQQPAEDQESTPVPENYKGPVEIGKLGIRFLSIDEVKEHHEPLLPHVEPARDQDATG